MNINFDNGEYIVLGLKDSKNNLYSYSSSGDRHRIEEVSIGEESLMSNFSVYPFDTFTTLDDEHIVGYERTYLKVNLVNNLSAEQIEGLRTSGIMYYKFGKKEIAVIEEFTKPFEYALAIHKKMPDRFGVYSAITWLIHETPFSNHEEEVMKEILDVAVDYYENYESEHIYGKLRLRLTPSKEMLRYVRHIRESGYKGEIDIEGYYRTGLKGEDIINVAQAGKLSLDDAFYMISKSNNIFPYLYHPEMTARKLRVAIENDEILTGSSLLYRDEYLRELYKTDFDMVELFEIYYDFIMKESHAEHYLTNEHLVEDFEYKPTIEEHDPYEYYCCSDCDGYDVDWANHEVSEYTEDIQVEFLYDLLRPWIGIVDESSLHLFRNWNPNIFSRVGKLDYSESFFSYVKLLADKYV